jgi:hypothetical protein
LSLLFIATVLLLAAVAYRIYRWQQELDSYRSERERRPDEPRGLPDSSPDEGETERQSPEDAPRAEAD